ncbi:bifunctional protein-disulfide isomerase/oxidoreductase DsbC [Alteromonas sp. ASW11-130]|uniref:bifunctional protein-disulfide isomerase/oxidoreductase DsbC n=1 Tax=Alteromonas sp. ASW11-130 TaxID=3015775 RepID=UPI0022428DFF|nr:bifunctional protein-disulfide isomerase/oxidoreductase DsbC [Alteromonas sp. ASW11-130]MCW8090475.1 bifunctional protein-disulfide isomerase/oxidoreductase DsbC [Alteromonas sp. ASW11-130]
MLTLINFASFAQDDEFSMVRKKIESIGLGVEAIADAPVEGLLQVTTERGLFYISEDGKYLLQARIFNVEEGMRNETELALGKLRLEGVEELSDSVIEFKAKNEKHVVHVFTDTTCGYCRKLHNEIGQYNDEGITVRYLAFPRAGLNTDNHQELVSVWCANNPQKAMTDAKSGDSVQTKTCDNQVAEHYQLGQKLGVTGTPAIILPSGMLVPGYQPANILAEALNRSR